jgi:DHA2 family multidrug resistance protein
VPLSTLTLSMVSREKMANATGIYTLLRQLGGSLGIAILQLLQTRYEDGAYQNLASAVTPANPAVSAFMRDAHGTAAALQGVVTLNATVLSYDAVLRICAIVFVLSVPLVLLLRGAPRTAKTEPALVAAD